MNDRKSCQPCFAQNTGLDWCVSKSPSQFICCFRVVPAADIELGLKRDTLGAVDGSSLEALLKGEPVDRRSGTSDVRGPEEDLAAAEPPATSAATHTSSGRVRKVWFK